jgi:hypothetical protein
MATPINAPMAGEIWHLSIEDLFQPVQEAPRLGGDGPFVINLSVSTAPISVPTKAFTNSPLDAHVYQIQVTEDGRTRYRLRLGPFASEDQADAILEEVRDTYPGALTATASASDLRVIATMQAKAEHRPTAPKPADLVKNFLSQRVVADKPAPEVAEKATLKAAVAESDDVAKVEVPEISIDIAWPTPELGVPPSLPLRTAPPVTAPPVTASPVTAPPVAPSRVTASPVAPPVAATPAAIKRVPSSVAASAPKPQLALPELDVPLPTIQKQAAAPIAPVPSATAAPAPKPFELKIAPPYSIASVAPILTEVVTLKKAPAPKNAAPKPAVIAAPVLTEAVVPKIKAPPVASTPAPVATRTAASPVKAPPPVASAPAAPAAATAAAPVKAPPKPETAPPSKQEIVPPPKKAVAPAPKQTMTAPPQPAIPKSVAPVETAKTAPVLTQSVAPARKGWPKFRAAAGKPMANKLTSLQHVVVATAPAPAPREVKKLDEPLESLECTQTIRALTPRELEDNEVSRWFVIQLALADHAFDPDAVPNLDIFSEYRLYSVAGLDQGRVVHALRLGFFREEIGAVAVASYLAAYWDKPTIKRVSLAERERFADQRVEARKDVGATGKHAIIEITDELVARRRRSTKAAAAKTSNRPIEH